MYIVFIYICIFSMIKYIILFCILKSLIKYFYRRILFYYLLLIFFGKERYFIIDVNNFRSYVRMSKWSIRGFRYFVYDFLVSYYFNVGNWFIIFWDLRYFFFFNDLKIEFEFSELIKFKIKRFYN